MKNLFYFVALAVVASTLGGCSKFQYASLQSDLPKTLGSAILENDTVKITYSFKGKNCPVRIQVANKSNKPVYIDWKKSALIINDQRLSYWEDKTLLNTSTIGHEVQWSKTISSSGSTTTGELFKKEQISFIPPKSFITATPVTAKNNFFELPKSGVQVTLTSTDPPGMGLSHSFVKENSPMKFRSYLTLSFDQGFDHPFYYDNQFWVSEVIETQMNPSTLNSALSADQFTLQKITGFGKFMGWLAGVAIIAGLVALKQ
jgi:hypothetical protein